MLQNNQDQAARRFQTFDNYECELPDDIRAQLGKPKRPRILERPLQEPRARSSALKWLLAFGLPALILVCVISSWQRERAAAPERAKINQAISAPTPLPVPQPTPELLTPSVHPTPGPARSWAQYLANNPSPAPRATLVQRVPRATLLKLPMPRAQLAGDLPPLVIGQRYLATMPYDNNLEVLMTFRGWLPSQDDLPSHPNRIGDMYLVGSTPWVWIWAPGAAHADWIDP